MSEDKLTADTVDLAVEKVLYPELHTKEIKVGERVVQLRPLPLFYAKKLYNVTKKLADLMGRVAKANESGNIDVAEFPDADMVIAETVVDAVDVLCAYYEFGWTKEEVEAKLTLEQAQVFVEAQLEVNKGSDFLLKPLSITMLVLRSGTKLNEDLLRVLRQSEASLSPGGFTQIESSESTQKPN